MKHHPTTVTAACENLEAAEKVQDLFMNQYFRVYTNDDVIGVEIGGALKNVIALGAGITDGLDYGDNAKAALITRGLAEITRLGVKMGGNPFTFSGLTGMGDLIVTCTSVHSRNWRAGNLLGKGMKLEKYWMRWVWLLKVYAQQRPHINFHKNTMSRCQSQQRYMMCCLMIWTQKKLSMH